MSEIETFFIRDSSTNVTYFFKGYQSGNVTKNSTITSYTTVEGTPMSDYSYRNLNTLSVSLIVSDLNSDGGYSYYEDAVYHKGGIKELKELLESWQNDCTLLTIQTRKELFENMCIQSVSFTDDDTNRGAFEPSISFQEQRRAVIRTVTLGPFADPVSRASNVNETSTGSDNGTSVAGEVGNLAGRVTRMALLGAAGGAVVGHPFIGAAVGAVGGIVSYVGSKFGWWD